jgi:hypothetical protein
MADIEKLRTFIESAATAVRAGLLTPSADDEKFVREYFGLPPMNADVVADWAKTEGARSPITIAAAEADKRTAQAAQSAAAADTAQSN